jgi:hypothetical protein
MQSCVLNYFPLLLRVEIIQLTRITLDFKNITQVLAAGVNEHIYLL